MAPIDAENGDIDYAEVENILKLGQPFPETSDKLLTQADVNELCDWINADVNIILERLSFVMPITDEKSLDWIEHTKAIGAARWALDAIGAQNETEQRSRAEEFWNEYLRRLGLLESSGGSILPADRVPGSRGGASVMPYVPTLDAVGANSVLGRSYLRSKMRLPQLARVQHGDNEETLRDRAPTEWLARMTGV